MKYHRRFLSAWLFLLLALSLLVFATGCAKDDKQTSDNRVTGNVVKAYCKGSDTGVSGLDEAGDSFSKENKCFGGVFLVTYACSGSDFEITNYRCDNGCENAKCL